jgi:precorrin-3B synthase
MPSGDGLIVRVRPHGGILPLCAVAALAGAACAFGNGHFDLTRRANLQIRGVRQGGLAALNDALARLGLLDASSGAEAIRNILVAPLGGLDPAAAAVDGVVRALETLLAGDGELQRLPPKFSFAIDGGGVLPLRGERADVRLLALPPRRAFLLGIEGSDAPHWLGQVGEAAAAEAAAAAARAFLEVRGSGRMRELSGRELAKLRAALAAKLGSSATLLPLQCPAEEPRGWPAHRVERVGHDLPRQRLGERVGQAASKRVGCLELGGGRVAVGIAAPFGRLSVRQLERVAQAVARAGGREVRLSPWRVLYAAARDVSCGRSLLGEAAEAGLITTPDNPLLRVEACPGKPDCARASLATRAIACRLAACLPAASFEGTLHVSGCPKGCARSASAQLTIVADGTRYLVIPNGTTQDAAALSVSPQELCSDPGRVLRLAGGPNA